MIVDVNVNLSRWPFRRTPCDELDPLILKCVKYRVQEAWADSIDGLFHRDIAAVNERLVSECWPKGRVRLVPFGSINPMLPDWQEDVRRCVEEYKMPGIRLHPNYHGYKLDEPSATEVLDLAARHNLIVQLVVRMDDVRVQHRLMRIEDVDLRPLAELIKSRPGLRLIVLNGLTLLHGAALQKLAAAGQVWFDISMQEGIAGVAELLKWVPPSRMLFGSHLPLYSLESAVLKMREAGLTRVSDGPSSMRTPNGCSAARDDRGSKSRETGGSYGSNTTTCRLCAACLRHCRRVAHWRFHGHPDPVHLRAACIVP